MVFRVPSQFDSFVPAFAVLGHHAPDNRQTRPWNGSLVVQGLRNTDRITGERIHVSAVETDGENRVESWPGEFLLEVLYTDSHRDILQEMGRWVISTGQPTCNFMPERLRSSNLHVYNLSTFRLLSQHLTSHRTVAVARWRTGELVFEGSGIIIYPALNSSAYLIGAVFHSSDFPEFVALARSPTVFIPAAGQQSAGPTYHGQPHPPAPSQPSMGPPPASPYGQQSQYRQHPSSSPHRSNSPVDQTSNYRYIAPMPARGRGAGHHSSTSASTNPAGGNYGPGGYSPFP